MTPEGAEKGSKVKGRMLASGPLSREAISETLAQDPEAAAALLAEAAESGLLEAQALLGQILLDGRGVAPNAAEAFQWFLKAGRSGHPMAMNMVGRCYDQGWGVPIDKGEAARWFKDAAARGSDWGMYNYASALGLGAGVPKDEAAALAWFQKAAALGHAKSLNFVGGFFEAGVVVERNMVYAAECYERAAEQGDFRGQFNHARRLFETGRADEAKLWLERARTTASPAFLATMEQWLAASPFEA